MSEPRTIGAYLRAARSKRRLSIEKAADDTRIRPEFLMRLESDEFDFLAPIYVRGFLRTYARYLRVDPQPLLEEFDRRTGTPRVDTSSIVALDRARSRLPKPPRRSNGWAVAAIFAGFALVVLAILGVVSAPDDTARGRDRLGSNVAASRATDRPATPTRRPSAVPELSFADGIEAEIIAVQDCWVHVTADGQELFERTLPAGSSTGPLRAETRMDVVLGNAGGVELVIEGKRFRDVGDVGQVFTFTLPDDLERLL